MTVVEERPAGAGMIRERRAMIDSQLRVSGVNDPAVLGAFLAVPREDFVPEMRRATAYADRAVPLGDGNVLAPALTYGQMLEAADPAKADKVLVIGKPGTYLAALAEKLSGSVTTAAPDGDLAEGGPYSLVLVDGAIETVPPALTDALADDGRLVTGLVERGVTRLAIGRKAAGAVVLATQGEADFAPLPEFAAAKTWSF